MAVCAYIDILGFRNFVREDPRGAVMLLQNYQVQFAHLSDGFPDDEYVTPYKKDSFKYLIPFSDSIFFYSEQPSEFVMQLAHFVHGSFSFTSHAFSDPEDAAHPENVTEKGAVWENGKVVTRDSPAKWYPLLFRGGIGFGDATIHQLNCIHNRELKLTPIVFGNSVIEAVKMESVMVGKEKIKGPRILCTPEFYDQLNEQAKKIVHPAFDKPDLFEVNWTAVNYLMTDDLEQWFVDQLLLNDFYLHLFVPAAVLWRAYRNTPSIEPHYKNFLKLIVVGIQHYLHRTPFLAQANAFIAEKIVKERLQDLSQFLSE